MSEGKRNPFLKLMKFLETSDGKLMNHQRMTSGMHEGQTAMGKYGLMPNTAKEMANRVKNKTELDQMIKNADPMMVESILNENPHKYDEYKKIMADHVLERTNEDPVLAATAWRYGHNAPISKLKEKIENNPGYKDRIEKAINLKGLASEKIEEPTFIEELIEEKPKDNVRYSRIRNKYGKNITD